MAIYVDRSDLEARLSAVTVNQLFKQDRTGAVDDAAVNLVLSLANAQVEAALDSEYAGDLPIQDGSLKLLLKAAALEYAISMSLERHPEYVRSFGENKKLSHWKRAEEIMAQVRQASKRIPGVTTRNRGGVTYSLEPRLFTFDDSGNASGDF